MSGHVSARYPVGCRTCGAEVGEACRTRYTKRVTDTHADRLLAARDYRATQPRTPAGSTEEATS